MIDFANPIEGRVTHVNIGRGHVNLRSQRFRSIRELSRSHPREQIQVFLDRTIAPWAFFARNGRCAAIFDQLVGSKIANVSFAQFDQFDRVLIELLEIVRGVEHILAPIKSEPADIRLDRIDIFHVFASGIRVVETQIANALVLQSDPEIEANRLGVADVQITVGFGWKSGHQLPAIFGGLKVVNHNVADKVGRRFRWRCAVGLRFHFGKSS